MARYLTLVLRFRFAVLALVTAITGLAIWSISHGVIASSMARVILGEHPGFARFLELGRTFPLTDVVAVGLHDPGFLTAPAQERLKRATRRIAAIPEVRGVRSVLDAQEIVAEQDSLIVRSYLGQARRKDADLTAIVALMQADPFVRDLLLARDGVTHAIIVDNRLDSDRRSERTKEIIDEIEAAFVSEGVARDDLAIVGLPVNVAAMIHETRVNVERLLPMVVVILLLVVWLIFRRLWPALMTTGVAILGVTWTMGVAIALDPEVNIMASLIPGTILIIATSDVIHLINAYLLELGSGARREDAIFAAGADVGRACFYTSITTFAGFVSMALVPTPMFREFGVVLGIGTALSLWIALTVVPVVLSLAPTPKPWSGPAAGRLPALIDHLLGLAERASTRHPRVVIGVFLALLGWAAVGVSRLHVEIDFASRLPEGHAVREDTTRYRDAFAGATTVDLYVDTGSPEGALDPALLAALARWQERADGVPDVTRVVSAIDLFRLIAARLGMQVGPEGLPTTREGLAQALLLFESGGGEDLDQVLDFEHRIVRATAYLDTDAARRTWQIGERLAADARAALGTRAPVEASGLTYLTGDWLDTMIDGQKRGLAFALAAIFFMMVLGMRSWRTGAWSMLPNTLPLFVLGGVLGWWCGQVDSDVLAVAMIAIGIGVDDTIHFLMRARIEAERGAGVGDVIARTFHFSGRGIVITSVILVLGFLPFASADYLSVVLIGTMLPMTLVVALLADLLLVPALLEVGLIRF